MRIKTNIKALFVVMLMANQTNFAQADKHLQAIHRTDNTFVSFTDKTSQRVDIPPFVAEKIKQIYIKYNENNPWARYNVRPLIFVVNYSKDFDIYVIKVRSAGGVLYKLMAYNKITFGLTNNPATIFGRFMDNREDGFDKRYKLLTEPLLYFKDIDGDGFKDIVVKERAHNGTAYNAEIDHVYKLDEQLKFKEWLCIESKCLYFDNLITRILKGDILYSELVAKGRKPVLVGEAVLNMKGLVNITSKKVTNPEFEHLLITGSGVDEDKFLKEGYGFHY